MNKPSVYLAGPISGLTLDGCNDWREWMTRALGHEIIALSPLRNKKARLSHAGAIADHYDDDPLTRLPGIVGRDRFDVMRADMVLVNVLRAERISLGTVMEVAWADLLRKPVVLVMEKQGNVHEHGMFTEVVQYRVETLGEAVRVVRAVLLPDVGSIK
jgi:nucleoside 2-deoxyribosyltransferase